MAFPLHPEIPEEGWTLTRLFQGRDMNINEMLAKLKSAADEAGLPFGERAMTFNTRRASELGKWAEEQGWGEDYHSAVFRAYFVHGRNIAKIPVLLEIVRSLGRSENEAAKALSDDKYRMKVDADWNRSGLMRIRAVPTFVAEGKVLVGARSYSVLEQFVKSAGAQRHS